MNELKKEAAQIAERFGISESQAEMMLVESIIKNQLQLDGRVYYIESEDKE